MRILILCHEHPPLGGGGGNAASQIARYLAKKGNEVTFLTSHFGSLPFEEMINGYRVQRININRHAADGCNVYELLTFMVTAVAPALKIVEQYKPETIISFFTLPGGYIAYRLNKSYRIPYIVSLRGGDVPGFLPQDLWLYHVFTKSLIRGIWNKAAQVVGNCQYLSDLAKKTEPKIEYKTILNGIDTELFRPADNKSTENVCRLLLVGRMERQRGLNYLFNALNKIKELPWRIMLIGDGTQKRKTISLVNNLGLSSKTTFLSWQSRENLIKYYQNADVFVFPTIDEGMSNAVREAMACGVPVITTTVGGNTEIVKDGYNGILISPQNVDEIAGAVKKLVNDVELRKLMSKNARDSVFEWTWEKVADKYWQLINNGFTRE